MMSEQYNKGIEMDTNCTQIQNGISHVINKKNSTKHLKFLNTGKTNMFSMVTVTVAQSSLQLVPFEFLTAEVFRISITRKTHQTTPKAPYPMGLSGWTSWAGTTGEKYGTVAAAAKMACWEAAGPWKAITCRRWLTSAITDPDNSPWKLRTGNSQILHGLCA